MSLKNNLKNVLPDEEEKIIEVDGEKIDYSVTTYGVVYSLNYRHTKKKIALKQNTDKDGYKTVVLYIHCKPKTFKVHRLVGLAFIPNPDNKPEINHIDVNVSNNCVWNLEWSTTKENIQWSWEHGNSEALYAEKSPYHKYQVSVIKDVCKLLEKNEYSLTEISNKTSVPISTVLAIKQKKQWTTISCDYHIDNHTKNSSRKTSEAEICSICEDIVSNKLTLTQIAHKYDKNLS